MRDYEEILTMLTILDNEPDRKDLAFEIKKIWEAISALQLAIINEVDTNAVIPVRNTNALQHPQRVFDMWGEDEDD
jgi:hypothetical protein